jgi:hypothetical protein
MDWIEPLPDYETVRMATPCLRNPLKAPLQGFLQALLQIIDNFLIFAEQNLQFRTLLLHL